MRKKKINTVKTTQMKELAEGCATCVYQITFPSNLLGQ